MTEKQNELVRLAFADPFVLIDKLDEADVKIAALRAEIAALRALREKWRTNTPNRSLYDDDKRAARWECAADIDAVPRSEP